MGFFLTRSESSNSVEKKQFNNTGPPIIGFVESFDVSPDDSEITFSYSHYGTDVNLYKANIDGSDVRKIVVQTDKEVFPIHPRYSQDGSKILFVSRDEGLRGPKGLVYMMNRDGSNVEAITSKDGNVLEAVFSVNDKKIYILKSALSTSYNKLAPNLPHEIDVYEVDIKNKSELRLTNLEAYSLSKLSISSNGNKLYFSGYVLSLNENPPQLKNLNYQYQTYFQFYSDDDSAFFCCPGQEQPCDSKLYLMDLNTNAKEFVSPQAIYGQPVVLHNSNKILFFSYPDGASKQIMILDLDLPIDTSRLLFETPRVNERITQNLYRNQELDSRSELIPIVVPVDE